MRESARLQMTGKQSPAKPSDPAAQRRIIKANRPGDSAGRMKTTHPALTEGGAMAHAASAPSGPPHRGSRKFTATALCWLLAGREHRGPAALTGQKADSKRGCAYRHRDHPPPVQGCSHAAVGLRSNPVSFRPISIPFRAWGGDPAPLNDASLDSPARVLSDH